MGRRILFIGPPGAGKGTQAALLSRTLGVPHISSGDMLREAVAEGTELGKQAGALMTTGDLVPDDLVVAMVAQRLAKDDAACGFLLDGFPRNLEQADALDRSVGGDAIGIVVLLTVDDDELVHRIMQRAVIAGRSDDSEETIVRRLEVFRSETEPLLRYYPEHGVPTVTVDGSGSVEDVFSRIVMALATER